MKNIKQDLVSYLDSSDLLRAALCVSKTANQDIVFGETEKVVLDLIEKVQLKLKKTLLHDPVFIVKQIGSVLFDEFKLQGKTEQFRQLIDKADYYYLDEVLKNKKGGPITMAILYSIIAEQVGLQVDCIAFPAHYILKIQDVSGDFYIDPFDSGRMLSASEFKRKFKAAMKRSQASYTKLYELTSPKQLVARLIQRLKHVYILTGDTTLAVRSVELLTALYPKSPELTRDRGVLYCEIEYFSQAMVDLQYYLKARPKATDIKEIKKLTHMIEGYQETMN